MKTSAAFKIVFSLLLGTVLLLSTTSEIHAAASDYEITNFDSQITINQDTSLTVTETITANFLVPKHGLIRVIPTVYSARGKTIKAGFALETITDETGQTYPFTKSRLQQSVNLKIGDPNKTITGEHVYTIRYRMNSVLQRFEDHDELYWNVTGHEWDTTILKASAVVASPYATVEQTQCWAGPYRSQDQYCTISQDANRATATTTQHLQPGDDFTIVVGLNQANQLAFPGPVQKATKNLADNWPYLIPLLTLGGFVFFWYHQGRDRRFVEDMVYYQKGAAETEKIPLFAREHLPLAYRPIDGLTPAEVGTILDEKVDLQDVVAEIVELARLGFIKIERTGKKGLFKNEDYIFTRLQKDPGNLKDHQKYLLEKLIPKTHETAKLSGLKGKFYAELEVFKKKLYEDLVEQKIFHSRPDKVRTNYLVFVIFLTILEVSLTAGWASLTGNSGPVVLSIVIVPFLLLLAIKMPRRTAWGHSLYRQTKGLQYYLDKGKWRQEIQEKHLFFEEILPLTISLGLVKKLARDMEKLGIKPPQYFDAGDVAFYHAFRSFASNTGNSLAVTPSGKSSWSGGSGFSGGGGSSGGGFGGGGGGSW